MKELVIEAKADNLHNVLDFVCAELESVDCPIKLLTQISIAVEEIFVNIASYAFASSTGDVVIRVAVNRDVVIEFEDDGIPYNPLDKEDPDICTDADERKIGGLGIFMAKNIMDSMEYRNTDNRNLLVLKKAIS